MFSAVLPPNARARVTVRPHVPSSSRGFEESQGAGSSAPCGRPDLIHEGLEVLAKAQTQLQSEEQGLSEGEARLAAFLQEADGMRVEEPQPTAPVDFAHELAELRACVQDLQRENQDLSGGRGAEERQRKSRNLSNSALDLVPMNRAQVYRTVHAVGQSLPLMNGALSESSVRMETMIDNADASLRSNRFNPLG